jgi:hypothetical protein
MRANEANCEQTGDYSEGCCCETCTNNGFGSVTTTREIEAEGHGMNCTKRKTYCAICGKPIFTSPARPREFCNNCVDTPTAQVILREDANSRLEHIANVVRQPIKSEVIVGRGTANHRTISTLNRSGENER